MAPDDCPDRPQSEADLDFTRKPMVRWFSPTELVRTGTESVLSSLFGAYADWREVQALRAHDRSRDEDAGDDDLVRTVRADGSGSSEWYDLSSRESLWIDYIADLGDGFAPTHTVARLLSEPALTVGEHDTERGRLLVMGGDQVYPAASRDAYRNRLVGPYRAALPCVTDGTPPLLFAVPGNHDWYDGLTSFLRLFTQNRWIGGWKTEQRRSYFAIKLPHDWWLWGIDVQLDSDIDEPQLNYFRSIASSETIMPSGSKVVLCTPEPSWLYGETEGPAAYHNLGYFQDEVISAYDHELKVGLAGDLHTYARYAEENTNEQRFIAGGGGAYLYPTHDLPDSLSVETPNGRRREFGLAVGRDEGNGESLYPSRRTSRALTWNALRLPFTNGGLAFVVAGLYLLFAWLLESATVLKVLPPADPVAAEGTRPSLLESMAQSGFGSAVRAFINTIAHTPSAVLLLLALLGGLYVFADVEHRGGRIVVGTIHTAAHLLLGVALMWAFAHLNLSLLPVWAGVELSATGLAHAILFTIEMVAVGAVLGGLLLGLYLVLTNRLHGAHTNEVFSCQHIPHYKNFLRLRVEEDGLTVYPLGVAHVETDWTVRDDGSRQEPWFDGTTPVEERVELIEPPISV